MPEAESMMKRTITRSLGYLARLREVFLQSKNVVLRRHGRRVTSHELPAYLMSQEFTAYRELQGCADCSLAVYASEADKSNPAARIGAESSDWERVEWRDWQEHLPSRGRNLPGLHFGIWYERASNTVIVAFRGTRFTSFADWYANLRWITRFVPGVNDHYVQAGALVGPMVAHLKDQYQATSVITTGHSLGGGIAQHVAYLSPDIGLVHAFASTPVTGFHSIEPDIREHNSKGLLIVRSFEHGEILAYLRFFLRRLVSLSEENPRIIELRFNCSSLLAISEHSMKNMATYLRQRFQEAVKAAELRSADEMEERAPKHR